MKENKYDNNEFFEKYSSMLRSKEGLSGAGEWPALKQMLPEFNGKNVLDLGCGYGWHCVYAKMNGAISVTGIDISEKMLSKAKEKSTGMDIEYIRTPIEDYSYPQSKFDIVISSLAFHYIENLQDIFSKVNRTLKPDGNFVFSCEHPVFTSEGSQQWYADKSGKILHFPVDNYFCEGRCDALFLGEHVVKYHRTLTTYIKLLLKNGFEIQDFTVPSPTAEMLDKYAEMKDELRRPMMMIISAKKKTN